jgi:hypothetical protein
LPQPRKVLQSAEDAHFTTYASRNGLAVSAVLDMRKTRPILPARRHFRKNAMPKKWERVRITPD